MKSLLRRSLLAALLALLLLSQTAHATTEDATGTWRIAGNMQIQRVMSDGSLVCLTPYNETVHVRIGTDIAIEHTPLAVGELIEVTYREPIDDARSTMFFERFDVSATRIRGAIYEGIVNTIDEANYSATLSGPMFSYMDLYLPKQASSLALSGQYIRFVPHAVENKSFISVIEAADYQRIETMDGIIDAIDAQGLDMSTYKGTQVRVKFTGDTRIHRVLTPGTSVSVFFVSEEQRSGAEEGVANPDEITATSVWVSFG